MSMFDLRAKAGFTARKTLLSPPKSSKWTFHFDLEPAPDSDPMQQQQHPLGRRHISGPRFTKSRPAPCKEKSHLIPRPRCFKTWERETSPDRKGFLFSLNSCARQMRQPSAGTPHPISFGTYLLMRSAVHCSPHSSVIVCKMARNIPGVAGVNGWESPPLANGDLMMRFVHLVLAFIQPFTRKDRRVG